MEKKETEEIVIRNVKPTPTIDFVKNMENYNWIVNQNGINLEKKLGGGASGEVFKGTYIGSPCAIKVIPVEDSIPSYEFDRIISEINILSKCHSLFVISFYGFYFTHKSINIVMELLDTDLKKLLPIEHNNDWRILNGISLKIISGIQYLHQSNILHLDLKPANVLLAFDFTKVKLVDFGMSVTNSKSTLFKDSIGGSYPYMSPEQILVQLVSFESDIYSFGALLFHLYTEIQPWDKKNPFEIISRTHTIHETLTVENINYLPVYLKEIMQRCFKWDPKERPSPQNIIDVFQNHI